MPSRHSDRRPSRTGAYGDDPQSLGLDDFAEPADEGLSLEQLGQAYAALLQRGSDPYPDTALDPGSDAAPTDTLAAADEHSNDADLPGEDPSACEVSPKSILEAVLFVGHPTGAPLTSERIAALMRGVRPAEIDELVEELNAEYEKEGSPYSIVSIGPGYQLSLRPQYGPLRDAFYGRIREARLSQATLDVLAVVAYHQPITQETIERLRGKPSGAILSQLVRRDLLEVERAPERKAKPTYRTTARFLDLFGLADLSELPRSREIEREL